MWSGEFSTFPKKAVESSVHTGKVIIMINKKDTFIHKYNSPIGKIIMAGSDNALSGLWFEGQKYFPDSLIENSFEKNTPVFELADKWLDIYFSEKAPDFTPPLFLRTTDFRRSVWDILLTVPFGHTMTYGEIAAKIAKEKGIPKMSAQAVGGAVSHNPVSIIIPCHRIIASDGSLTDYAGGIEKKIKLLELEKAVSPEI